MTDFCLEKRREEKGASLVGMGQQLRQMEDDVKANTISLGRHWGHEGVTLSLQQEA